MLRASRSPLSGYYAHKQRLPSPRALSDAALAETIEAVFFDRDKGRGVYGARKMAAQLRRDGVGGPGGAPVARCTVERLMRSLGFGGATGSSSLSSRAASTSRSLTTTSCSTSPYVAEA